ncbi:hypothetical protein Csa_022192 [Cucumis sativus]|uniref:Uncharacterized protein n=1 Tax=Cucumis sativus TaxID=3659 RepID=A0A0A0LQW1_CUCSA|nr:hypothetical protein Csa_022192 [Cucumis sativus]
MGSAARSWTCLGPYGRFSRSLDVGQTQAANRGPRVWAARNIGHGRARMVCLYGLSGAHAHDVACAMLRRAWATIWVVCGCLAYRLAMCLGLMVGVGAWRL